MFYDLILRANLKFLLVILPSLWCKYLQLDFFKKTTFLTSIFQWLSESVRKKILQSLPWNITKLKYFIPLISFDTPWKHQKTSGFLIFSEGIKRDSSVKWANSFLTAIFSLIRSYNIAWRKNLKGSCKVFSET